MHPIFSISLFTGQQLIQEAIQRWLARPCADPESQRQRRLGLKGLVSLLVKTTATGVLATVLDVAIEFRRRQRLVAAAADPEDSAAGGGSFFPGLGMLSRAGIASWKARLLLGIDELERRAEAYGIESRHRLSPGKLAADESSAASSSSKAAASVLPRQHASCLDLVNVERSQRLGATMEQLQGLVKQGDPDSQRRLDDEVGSLVDLLLGTASLPPTPSAVPFSAAASRSCSVPAALDRLGRREAGGTCGCMRASRSRLALAHAASEECEEAAAAGEEPSSPCSSCGELCQVCMDRVVNVQVAGCQHTLCFGCARRLCDAQDHSLPQCPFCRQAIDGFVAIVPSSDGSSCGAACPATVASTLTVVHA